MLQQEPNEQLSSPDASAPLQSIETALDDISHALDQMLALAQLSASDLNLDRNAMQKTLERLQSKIDRIADQL